MENVDIVSSINNVFEIVLFFMGLIFGGYFIFLGTKKKRHLLLLGLFLLSYNFFYLTNIANHFQISIPNADLLPIYFLYLSLPVFILYIKRISIYDIQKKDYIILLPALIEFLYLSYLWMFKDPIAIRNSNIWIFYILGAFIFNTVLALVVLYHLVRHLKNKKKRYTRRGKVQLHWARNVVITVVASLILLSNLRYLGYTNQVFILNHTYDLLMLSSVVFFGFITRNTTCFVKSIEDCTLTKIESDEIRQKIQDYLTQSEDYCQKDFSILQLYNATQISPHKISTVLNLLESKNFNSYINGFRVEKIKDNLKNKEYQKYTIDAIGTEVGFNSKSVFYREFKKHTGQTPFEYRKLVLQKAVVVKVS